MPRQILKLTEKELDYLKWFAVFVPSNIPLDNSGGSNEKCNTQEYEFVLTEEQRNQMRIGIGTLPPWLLKFVIVFCFSCVIIFGTNEIVSELLVYIYGNMQLAGLWNIADELALTILSIFFMTGKHRLNLLRNAYVYESIYTKLNNPKRVKP